MKQKIIICILLMTFISVVAEDINFNPLLQFEMWNFLSNSEYIHNDYKVGEPYFGTQMRVRAVIEPFKDLEFSVGIFLRKYFGDTDFLSDIQPIFRMQYNYKNFDFIFGELTSKKMLDAMLSEQYELIANPDEGIEISFSGKYFSNLIWGIYPQLHTAEHREHLCIGNKAKYRTDNLRSWSYSLCHGWSIWKNWSSYSRLKMDSASV